MLKKFFLLLIIASPAPAQSFDFQIDQASSSSVMDAWFEVFLPATVIGNHDAATNPGGTRTVNGLFGGSGNENVGMDITLASDGNFAGSPTGSFGLNLNIPSFLIDIQGINIDVLGGSTAISDANLTLLFSTFVTYNPDSLFIGGIPFNIPLGAQTMSSMTLQQSLPSASGSLFAGANPDEYDFTVAVPVDLTMVVDFAGTPTTIGPVALIMPVTGTVTLSGGAATTSIEVFYQHQALTNDPLPGFVISDLPIDIPTILPPGSLAHLLLTSTIGYIDDDVLLDVDVIANGTPSCGFESYCTANPNSTGLPASISVSGSPVVSDADLTFSCASLPTNQFGYFLMSEQADFIPNFGGSQGNLCIGSPLYRFSKDVLSSGSSGTMTFSPDFADLPQGTTFTPGSNWYFQLWHRDISSTSNTTSGISVQFCL